MKLTLMSARMVVSRVTLCAMLTAALMLAGCVNAPVAKNPEGNAAGVPLTNTYWQLVSIAGKTVPQTGDQQKAHILFLDDGRVSGFSGCNQFMGNYRVNNDSLLFDSMGSTRRACPDNLTEELLFVAFARTVGINLEGTRLKLLGEDAEVLAVFEATQVK